MQTYRYHALLVLLLSFSMVITTHAGILAGQTRLLFEQGQRENSLMLANINDYPIVLQTWVDQGEANPDHVDQPFIVLPPISKMPAHALQSIRVIYNEQRLPTDRESVFWLNLYEIPAVKSGEMAAQHHLSMSMNTQMKIFFRPKKLKKINVVELAQQLSFSLQMDGETWHLICHNPTAYHASLVNIHLKHQQQLRRVHTEMDMMSDPKSTRQFVLDGVLPSAEHYQLSFSLIDDHGQRQQFEKSIGWRSP